MQPNFLIALALGLAALASLLLAGLLITRIAAWRRSDRTLMQALDKRAMQNAAAAAARVTDGTQVKQSVSVPASGMRGRFERLAHAGVRWLDTPVGRHIVAEEDRRLLEQCGFVDARTRGLFLISRIAGATVLPLLVGAIASGRVDGPRYMMLVVVAIACGVMIPKLVLSRRAAARRRGVVDELPMLVDLLRLLQGVGLSLDQSLQVMVNDFRGILPVLSSELEIAQRQFAAGRTREQSLQRLASSYENEDLRAVVRLLIQVDRHGGAVQEPLKQFGDRLRETRRAMLRERIGRMAVKMTGVMILTLLPALMIVTAGPGVLSVSHALKAMNR
ncbi:type II secretion system F family protein [Paraburkholderia caffeinilytica]|uniref:type II secretion system F family protein n=1 Tax=Paraburkholderia caffeinilytica TaxID=1761016 RepID=UPI003DA0A148